MKKMHAVQLWILFMIILADFIAQIPYTVHLYGAARLVKIFPGSILMYAVFVWFLAGFIFFMQKKTFGYRLLISFLAVEFLFYLWNFVGSLVHGFPLFFQLANPDMLLRIVFAIGYLNLFASGYFFVFLLFYKSHFLAPTQKKRQ